MTSHVHVLRVVRGSRGLTVQSVMEDEINMAMRLLGINKLDQVHPGMVECLQELWK